MPQFDVTTYPSQIFWLIVCFAALFFVLSKLLIPKISEVLQVRQEKIEDDLMRAEKLKNEAADVLEAYNKAIAEARGKAQAELKASAEALAAKAAKGKESEARIAEARVEALSKVKVIATETAQLAARRLIGEEVGEDQARKAVETVVEAGS